MKGLLYIFIFVFGLNLNSQNFKEDSDSSVDKRPEFPGGVNAMKKFITYNLSDYSNYVRETSLGGRVLLRFNVYKDGTIDKVMVIKSSSVSVIDSLATVVIKKMPKWTPAEHKGEVVNSYMNIPINFGVGGNYPVFIFNSAIRDTCYLKTKKLIINGIYSEAYQMIKSCTAQGQKTYYLEGVLHYKLKEKKKAKLCFEKVLAIKDNSDYYQHSKSYLEKLY